MGYENSLWYPLGSLKGYFRRRYMDDPQIRPPWIRLALRWVASKLYSVAVLIAIMFLIASTNKVAKAVSLAIIVLFVIFETVIPAIRFIRRRVAEKKKRTENISEAEVP